MSPVNFNKASGVMIQAKKAFAEATEAKATQKYNRNWAIAYGACFAVNAPMSVLNACAGNTEVAICTGVTSGWCGAVTGSHLARAVEASKKAKEASQTFADIIKKKEFMDVLNRYLRIHKAEEMTTEQFSEAARGKFRKIIEKHIEKRDKV